MNQWTVPLEWNGGMEYWNDLWHFKINLEKLVICDVCGSLVNKILCRVLVKSGCKLVNNSLADGHQLVMPKGIQKKGDTKKS